MDNSTESENQNTLTEFLIEKKIPFIIGFTIISLIAIWIFLDPILSSVQYQFFRVLCSLGIAGMSVFLPGKVYANWQGFKAIGAIAFFLLVFNVFPSEIKQNTFSYSITLTNEDGNFPNNKDGYLNLNLKNEIRHASINKLGAVNFLNIPPQLKDSEIELSLDLDGWVFFNKRKTILIELDDDSQNIKIMREINLCCYRGRIYTETGEFIPNAKVQIDTISSISDEMGIFNISIPKGLQSDEKKMIIIKNGYNTWEKFVKPSNNINIEAVLIKE